MKKFLPYIIGLAAVLLIAIVFLASNTKSRFFNERITLKKEDKIPYGTYAAKKLLPSLFPDADVAYYKGGAQEWQQYAEENNQALVAISKQFYADEEELYELLRFVQKGNYVFISAQNFSPDATTFFHLTTTTFSPYTDQDKGLRLRLEQPPFSSPAFFEYPGRKFENAAYDLDTTRTTILGRDASGMPNFVRLDAGEGSFFIHLAPLAFSNYFLLYKSNIEYYQQALSAIPKDVETIVWDESYLLNPANKNNSNNEEKNPSWLRVLMKYPAFKWGLWLVIATIVLYAVMEMRRKQRFIPSYERPQNDSLDFVKTIGRLYYDRRDHHNLARKMATYFLEHVRSNYKLPTHTLDERFVQVLHFKSGYPLEGLNYIISFIQSLDKSSTITEQQLSAFYKQLETFYGTT